MTEIGGSSSQTHVNFKVMIDKDDVKNEDKDKEPITPKAEGRGPSGREETENQNHNNVCEHCEHCEDMYQMRQDMKKFIHRYFIGFGTLFIAYCFYVNYEVSRIKKMS